jgi:hypothetical protein
VYVRGHENVLKRLLVHAGAFNLGLWMRTLCDVGTPRGLQGHLVALGALLSALWSVAYDAIALIGSQTDRPARSGRLANASNACGWNRHLYHGLLAVMLPIAGSSCREVAAPTPVPAEIPRFSIRADVTSLAVGESHAFAAVLSTTATETIVDAVWMSDRPDVCRVTREGVATAIRQGSAILTASDAQRVASVSLEIVPIVQGDWSGQIELRSARRITGGGPLAQLAPVGTVAPYIVHIQQSHDRITATDGRNEGIETYAGAINGSGLLTLVGRGDQGPDAFHIDTNPWGAQLDGSATTMAGEFVDTFQFVNFWGLQVYEERFTITQLLRQPSPQ